MRLDGSQSDDLTTSFERFLIESCVLALVI